MLSRRPRDVAIGLGDDSIVGIKMGSRLVVETLS